MPPQFIDPAQVQAAQTSMFGPPPAAPDDATTAMAQAPAPQGDVWSRHFREVSPQELQAQSMQGSQLPPEAAGLQGKEFIEAIRKTNPGMAARLERVGRGDEAYPTGFALKAPINQALIQMLGQAYPGFSASDYGTRAAQKKNYQGGGKQFQELQAINTVADHIPQLMETADKLHNFEGLGPLNAPVNSLVKGYREMSQDPRLVDFEAAKSAVTRELTKAYQGGHITDSSIAEWQSQLNAAQSPTQLRTVIGRLNDLLASKRAALEQGWLGTMGDITPPREWQMESQKTKHSFDRVNQWAHPELANQQPAATPAPAAAPPPGNYIYVPGKGLVPR